MHISPSTTALSRKALRRFVEMNRLTPGARALLVGPSDNGLADQLIALGIDAMRVDSADTFDEPNVELVVDCACKFADDDLETQSLWQQTAELLSRVCADGSLCFVFDQAPPLTITALHRHLVPFAEAAEKPTGHDTDQIQVEIVKQTLFRRNPARCLAAIRVPSPAPDAATWHRRAVDAASVTKAERSAA
jgi:hypothetical protein